MTSKSTSAAPKVYQNRLSYRNRIARVLWAVVWSTLYRFSPTPLFGWRIFLLRCFGARMGPHSLPYPDCRIWAPWNLTMEAHSCLANQVDCYCVDEIVVGEYATVSQQAMLCTATHDYNDPEFRLITRPIVIGARAWVAAKAFVGPGVTIGEGAVVGAAACVFRDVEDWTVVGGNPARPLKKRILNTKPASEE